MDEFIDTAVTATRIGVIAVVLAWCALGHWVRTHRCVPAAVRRAHLQLETPFAVAYLIVLAAAWTLHGSTTAALWGLGMFPLWAAHRPLAEPRRPVRRP